MNKVKLIAVSFVLAIVTSIVFQVPQESGKNWLAFLITAWIMKVLCLEENTPHYKKVFLHAIWISVVKTVLTCALAYQNIKLGLQTYDIDTLVGTVIISIPIYYVLAVITGLVTVAWLSKTKLKSAVNIQETPS
jgi:hypothetical protein